MDNLEELLAEKARREASQPDELAQLEAEKARRLAAQSQAEGPAFQGPSPEELPPAPEKGGGLASLFDSAAGLPGKALTGYQNFASGIKQEVAGVPNPDSTMLTRLAANIVNPRRLMFGETGPTPSSIMAAHGLGGVLPGSGLRDQQIEADPGYQAAEEKLRGQVGDTGSAALQTAAGLSGQIPLMAGGVASLIKGAGSLGLGGLAANALKSLPAAAVGSGAFGLLGAPEGQRWEGFKAGATDPKGIGLGVLLMAGHGAPESPFVSPLEAAAKQVDAEARPVVGQMLAQELGGEGAKAPSLEAPPLDPKAPWQEGQFIDQPKYEVEGGFPGSTKTEPPTSTTLPTRNTLPIPNSKSPLAAAVPDKPAGSAPLPPDYSLAPSTLDELHEANNIARDPGVADWARKFLQLGENRSTTPGLQAYAIRQIRSAQKMKDFVMERMFPILDEAAKGLPALSKAEFEKMSEQAVNYEGKVPEGHQPMSAQRPEVQDLFGPSFKAQQSMEQELGQKGYMSPSQVVNAKLRREAGVEYMPRRFEAFRSKLYSPDPGLLDKVAKELMDADPRLTMRLATRQVKDFLGKGKWKSQADAEKAFSGKFLSASLKDKGTMSPAMRDLLKPVHRASYNMADGFAETAAQHHMMKVTEAMTGPEFKGQLWNDDWSPGMNHEQVGAGLDPVLGKQKFGEFYGKYVHEGLHEVLHEAPLTDSDNFVGQALQSLTRLGKRGQALFNYAGPTANFVKNVHYGTAAGIGPLEYTPRIAEAIKAVKAYSSTLQLSGKSVLEDPVQLIHAAFEDGALSSGVGADLRGSKASGFLDDLIRSEREGSSKWLHAVQDFTHKFGQEKVAQMWELSDAFHRIAAYKKNIEVGINHFGLSENQARAYATRMVNENFPSPNVGQGLANIARKNVLAPYMAWHAGDVGVMLNWLKAGNLKQTGAIGAAKIYRLARLGAMMKAASVAYKYNHGITDTEEGAYNAMLSPSDEKKAGLMLIGIGNNHGSLGADPSQPGKTGTFVDLSRFSPFSMFLKGDPSANAGTRIAQNLIEGYVRGGWGSAVLESTLDRFGLVPEAFPKRNASLPGEGLLDGFKQVYENAMPRSAKQVINSALRYNEPEGEQALKHEPESAGEAAWNAVSPAPLVKAGATSLNQKTQSENARRRELTSRTANRVVQGKPSFVQDPMNYLRQSELESIGQKQGERVKLLQALSKKEK